MSTQPSAERFIDSLKSITGIMLLLRVSCHQSTMVNVETGEVCLFPGLALLPEEKIRKVGHCLIMGWVPRPPQPCIKMGERQRHTPWKSYGSQKDLLLILLPFHLHFLTVSEACDGDRKNENIMEVEKEKNTKVKRQ